VLEFYVKFAVIYKIINIDLFFRKKKANELGKKDFSGASK
jgi:hypothetical protein